MLVTCLRLCHKGLIIVDKVSPRRINSGSLSHSRIEFLGTYLAIACPAEKADKVIFVVGIPQIFALDEGFQEL
jgi:hypothetical protein